MSIKLAQPFPAPELRGKTFFTDTRIFLKYNETCLQGLPLTADPPELPSFSGGYTVQRYSGSGSQQWQRPVSLPPPPKQNRAPPPTDLCLPQCVLEIDNRVGFWQNRFFADFDFRAAGFFRRISSPHFRGGNSVG